MARIEASKMFKVPENLTKERLKAELRKRGVSFEPHGNKDYYVQLYKREALKAKATPRTRAHRGELSSDEEFMARHSPRHSLRKRQQQVPGWVLIRDSPSTVTP